MARQNPDPFQQFVRGIIRSTIQEINGNQPEKPITLPKLHSEAWYRDRLAEKLRGEKEVFTPVGRIDIVTDTEIIELKNAKHWKGAIGQIKSYGKFYPDHQPRIHLFGEITKTKLQQVQSICSAENIILTWES
ncbi:MAG: hypothetical protein VKL20_08105 [Synechocystis sp.]|nr:hypothetical protein [Synechocystis sp.]